MARDYTLKDNNRRDYTFADNHQIEQVLPDYFKTEFPKLLQLLEYYYQFEDSDQSSSRLIHDIILSRDITANDITLLSFIEQELLLGESYFEGFKDKRTAAKFSNTLYRSKGTLYSIQQFFRMFFGVDPDVSYPKDQRFIVGDGPSKLGAESLRFLTDDKLYQVYALLIKTSFPISKWRDAYKLFVHPAGMYVGSEVLIEAVVEAAIDINMPDYVSADDGSVVVEAFNAEFATFANADLTGIVDSDGKDAFPRRDGGRGGYGKMRIDLLSTIKSYQDLTIQQIENNYKSLQELSDASSPLFDGDSSTNVATTDQSHVHLDTFDQVDYPWYDSIDYENIVVVEGVATVTPFLSTDITGIVDSSGRGTYAKMRIDLPGSIATYQTLTLAQINQNYKSMQELISPTSPSFDADSSTHVASMDQDEATMDTMDEVVYPYYDSDSA